MNTDWRPHSPLQAWHTLLEGNRRFMDGQPHHPNQDVTRRIHTASSQAPFAVIFGCSDSRVAAEIIFDRGLGDLFVVRTAGHLVGTEVLASIEFAVTVLQTPLVVVLGHDSCGAVTAAVSAHDDPAPVPGFMGAIIDHLRPDVRAAHARGITDNDAIARAHTVSTSTLLIRRSELIRQSVADGACAVVGASYHLRDGHIHRISSIGLGVADEVRRTAS